MTASSFLQNFRAPVHPPEPFFVTKADEVIQSGLTCALAAAIASFPFMAAGTFVAHWLQSWFIAWVMMLPVVLFAAPGIRNVTHMLTRED